ncbi:MAG: acyl-CoA thioesterase [Planctomycetota bacterium]
MTRSTDSKSPGSSGESAPTPGRGSVGPGDGTGAIGRIQIRVRYADTDCGGVVYHANYLAFFEQGRSELLRDLGASYRAFEEQEASILVVVDAQLRFLSPARYDDLLEVETRVTQVGGARLQFAYRVFRAGSPEVLCTGTTELGCVRADNGRARRLPEPFRALLAGCVTR